MSKGDRAEYCSYMIVYVWPFMYWRAELPLSLSLATLDVASPVHFTFTLNVDAMHGGRARDTHMSGMTSLHQGERSQKFRCRRFRR
jgi:hypothetical protein